MGGVGERKFSPGLPDNEEVRKRMVGYLAQDLIPHLRTYCGSATSAYADYHNSCISLRTSQRKRVPIPASSDVPNHRVYPEISKNQGHYIIPPLEIGIPTSTCSSLYLQQHGSMARARNR